MNCSIRIIAPYEDVSGIIPYLSERCAVLVAVEHAPSEITHNKPELHIHVEECTVKQKRLYQVFTKYGVPKGNSGRSITNPIDRNNITHISQGRLIAYKGITIDEFNQYRSNYREANRPPPSDKDICDETKAILLNTKYNCACDDCTHANITNSEVQWDFTNTHQHVKHTIETIIQTRRKYRLDTTIRLLKSYIFTIYTVDRPLQENGASIFHLIFKRIHGNTSCTCTLKQRMYYEMIDESYEECDENGDDEYENDSTQSATLYTITDLCDILTTSCEEHKPCVFAI